MTDTDPQIADSEQAGAQPPQANEAPASKAKPKKEPVTTLVGYLEGRTAAPAFLKHLRDAGIWRFTDEDRQDATSRHRDLDPRFTKTATLLAHSMKTKDESLALPVSDFARRVLLDRLRGDYPLWIGTRWEELSPQDRAYKVADAVARRFTDAKRGREAQNLMATALLLLAQESLDSEVALRATVRALEAHADTSPRRERERVQFIAGPRSKLPELRATLQVVLPWVEKADTAAAALTEATAVADAARRRREHAEAEGEARALRIAELEAESEALKLRIGELEEELRSNLVHGTHTLDLTRSSARAFLQGRLLGLLETTSEALDLDPPRVHIAQEKLEIAREAIEEQLNWLKQ